MTSTPPDPYAVLGVLPTATQAEVSHAYRTLLRQHHPDTRAPANDPQDTADDQALQQVLAAYTVLRHPARRADHDQHAEPRTHPPLRSPQHTPDHQRAYRQPPIIAGPVRWHQDPNPPSP